MIRRMRLGEEDKIRTLLGSLDYEDQALWRKETRTLEECLSKSSRIPISDEIKGKNIILVAEETNIIIGLCWCAIVDRGIDKHGEIAEFYVATEYRGKGIGKGLIEAAREVFIKEGVEVAFVWTHHGNDAAIRLYKEAGFKEVTQLVMALALANEAKI